MTAAQYLLGLDIGTTATKCIVLHPERGIVASASAPATLRSPYAIWAEEDPHEWWTMLQPLALARCYNLIHWSEPHAIKDSLGLHDVAGDSGGAET